MALNSPCQNHVNLPDEKEEVEDDPEDEPPTTFGFVTLKECWLLKSSTRTVLIRSCYAALLDKIVERLTSKYDVLLTGSAGIGKTQLQVLLFQKLCLNENCECVVLDLEDNFFIRVKPKLGSDPDAVTFGTRGQSFHAELASRSTFYLFDARPNVPMPLDVEARTCVSASPSRGHVALQEWGRKRNLRAVPERVYVPMWSLEEILALLVEAQKNGEYAEVTVDNVRDLFALYGGNLRSCLSQYYDLEPQIPKARQELQGHINACNVDKMLDYLGAQDALSDKLDRVSHGLLEIIPSQDFSSFSFAFCSDFVASSVLAKHDFQSLKKFTHLLAHNTDAVFAGIRGQAYEAHVHRNFHTMVPSSRLIQVRQMRSDSTSEPHQLRIPPLAPPSVVFDRLNELPENKYGVPRSRNFAAVDAVIRRDIALQMTVSHEHGLDIAGLNAVKAGLGLDKLPLKVVMVCPPDVVPNVQWQKLYRGKKVVKSPQGLKDGVGLMQYCLAFEWK